MTSGVGSVTAVISIVTAGVGIVTAVASIVTAVVSIVTAVASSVSHVKPQAVSVRCFRLVLDTGFRAVFRGGWTVSDGAPCMGKAGVTG